MATTTCPVFRPNLDEFSNFGAYLERIIDEVGYSHGILKVIPPSNFFDRDYSVEKLNAELAVKHTVTQVVNGNSGTYSLDLVAGAELSLDQFYNLACANDFEEECYYEREKMFWKSIGCGGYRTKPTSQLSASKRSNSRVSRRSSMNDWMEPIYGADVVGSLFGDCKSPWNVNNLETPLKLLEGQCDGEGALAGVTNSMLYFGMWRAMFAFHTEDMNLYSINYLHTGAAKSWYSIAEKSGKQFESLARSQFPSDAMKCNEFLRHKTCMLSPNKLKDCGIRFDTVLQEPGEFVITLAGAYHAGFNHGFNIAEASNFILPDWFSIGRKAGVCKCEPFNVSIDVDMLETLYKCQLYNKSKKDGDFDELRCVCGVRDVLVEPDESDSEDTSNEVVCVAEGESEEDMLQCKSCRFFFHNSCVMEYVTTGDVLGVSLPPFAMTVLQSSVCHMCFDIQSKEWSKTNKKMKECTTGRANPTSQTISQEKAIAKVSPTWKSCGNPFTSELKPCTDAAVSKSGPMVPSNGVDPKSKPKSGLSTASANTMKDWIPAIGDIVYLYEDDVTATVVDIWYGTSRAADTTSYFPDSTDILSGRTASRSKRKRESSSCTQMVQGRLHVSGTPKADDIWFDLSDVDAFSVVSSNNQANKNTKSKSKLKPTKALHGQGPSQSSISHTNLHGEVSVHTGNTNEFSLLKAEKDPVADKIAKEGKSLLTNCVLKPPASVSLGTDTDRGPSCVSTAAAQGASMPHESNSNHVQFSGMNVPRAVARKKKTPVNAQIRSSANSEPTKALVATTR